MRLVIQCFVALENFGRVKHSSPILIATFSQEMQKNIKACSQKNGIVFATNGRICVTLLRYNVDKPESTFARVGFFAGKKDGEKFQHINFTEKTNLMEKLICVKRKLFMG